MRKFISKFVFSLLMITAVLSGCKEPEPIPPRGDYDGGYVVLNEGQFLQSNATVSFMNENFTELEDSIYYKVNGEPLGDVAQSQFFNDDKAYFVINNSHYIAVANRWTMEKLGLITSKIRSPRYMVKVSDRYAVVSNWGEVYDANWQDVDDDFLAWVDLENDVVTDTISIETGPEKMLFLGGKLYVLIPGVMSSNNKIAVVDPAAHSILKYIETGDKPAAIVSDDNDNIWVLNSGNPSWTGNETNASLVKIDPVTDEIIWQTDLEAGVHPRFMVYDEGYLYIIILNKLYKVSVDNPVVDASAEVLDLNGTVQTVYGMSLYEDKLFITDAKDYQSPGSVAVFDLNTFQLIGQLTAGFLPKDVAPNF